MSKRVDQTGEAPSKRGAPFAESAAKHGPSSVSPAKRSAAKRAAPADRPAKHAGARAKSTAGPRPGQPARGSRTGRPIMALLDLLGRRWALRVGWELRAGPLGFRALQAACTSIPPASLSQRLDELASAGVVADSPDGWTLTDEGRSLFAALEPLQAWADRWSRRAWAPVR